MKTSRIADEDSVSKEIKYIHTYIHTSLCKISRHVIGQNFKLRLFIVVSHSLGRKFFELCKINELTCAYMFSQAHLQKNTHKNVFGLVEISNIYCVFLLRNANIFIFAF